MCRPCFHGQRYCSDACRQKARRLILAKARKKYRESVRDSPEQAVREAARAKHRVHQAAFRGRLKAKADGARVRGSEFRRSESCSKMEGEGAAAQYAPDAPSARPSPAATPAGARFLGARSDETFRVPVTRGQCFLCGVRGEIRWVVDKCTGTRRSAWKRFDPEGDP